VRGRCKLSRNLKNKLEKSAEEEYLMAEKREEEPLGEDDRKKTGTF